MKRRNARTFEAHSFYCINCGNKSYDLPRNMAFQRGKAHRKKLYCLTCKETVNHIECRNDSDVYDFKNAFEKGEFVNEAAESLSYVRASLL